MFNNARLLDLVSDDVDVLPLVERVALGAAQQVLHSSHCTRTAVRLSLMLQDLGLIFWQKAPIKKGCKPG